MFIHRLYRRFLAVTRFNLRVVCEESEKLGRQDYHDCDDSDAAEPWNWVNLTCRRCGKQFKYLR